MAVEYPTVKVSYKGNGSTRTFSFNFPIRKEEHLKVTTTNLATMEVKVLNLGADYDVSPIDNTYPSDGGSITYPRDISTPALAEGMSITITRVVPYTQPDIYSENSTLIPKQIENSLDNLEYQIQQINDKTDSSVRIPDGVDYSNDDFISRLFTAEVNAKQSETNAKQSETNARQSETLAKQYADEAKETARGIGNPVSDITIQNAIITVSKADGSSSRIDLEFFYPVGIIYMSVISTNPHDILGFGTWEAMPAGRVLLAQGNVETENYTHNFVAGETGGEFVHQLTVGEMPSHSHIGTITATAINGSMPCELKSYGNPSGVIHGNLANPYAEGSNTVRGYEDITINATHTHAITINNIGSSQAHNNIQPYIAVYMWKRTA